MKITAVATSLHRFPLPTPWQDSRNRVTHLELLVCRIQTETNLEGMGVSYTGGHGGSAALAFIQDVLAPLITDDDATRIEHLWQLMWHRAHDPGGRGLAGIAISAIDIALWDLAGKRTDTPLHILLGGAKQEIPAYSSGINLGYTRTELQHQVEGWLDAGYTAVKIKVGRPTLGEDHARVSQTRELIGNDRLLMIDANQAWTAGEAVRRMHVMTELDPYWIEEPLRSDDAAGHAHLRATTPVPLAVGENLHSKFEFADYIGKGAIDIVQADAVRLGGITEWLKVAHLAEAANLVVAPHFLLELSGSLCCGVANSEFVEDVHGGSLTELGALAEPLPVVNGHWRPNGQPGHGLIFDEKALERTRIA